MQESNFATLPAASLNDRTQTEHLFATFIVFGGDDIVKNNKKKNREKKLGREIELILYIYMREISLK